MATSALTPVATGLFTLLNVTSLTGAYPTYAGCTGGVRDNVPQPASFPFLWYELKEKDISGMGQAGGTKQLELRLHVYSLFPSSLEENRIMAEAIRLVQFQTFTESSWRVPPIERAPQVLPLGWTEINGIACRELVCVWDNLFADAV